MKNSLTLGIFISILFLASCGNDATTVVNTSTEKQVFTIKTNKLADFGTDLIQEKTAVIQANSTLSLVAESS